MKNKKGSLNISIEAIVIIVIALTVLSIGIVFVRNMGQQWEEIFKQVLADIKEKVMEDLRTGDKKLSFHGSTIEGAVLEETVTGLGVRNIGDDQLKFTIHFFVKDAEEVFQELVAAKKLEITVPEKESIATIKLDWDSEIQTLNPGEDRFFPILLKLPSLQGNYLFKVKLLEEDGTEYDTKSFFVKTN